MDKEEMYFEVMIGSSSCLCITDGEGTGVRICGEKQWGGGSTLYKWKLSKELAKDVLNNIFYVYPELNNG